MGAMTDPDCVDEETKAKHQANNKDTTGRDAKSQGKKPTKDHTETNGAANPDRAKKETEAKHQENDEKGKTEAHNTKEAEHQGDNIKVKTKVHEQQEYAAGGQLDGKERNLIRSNQPGPQEPKALFRPRGRGVTKNKITGQHRHNEDPATRWAEAKRQEDQGDGNQHGSQGIRRNDMQYQAGDDGKARGQSGAHPTDITNNHSPEERTHIRKKGPITTNLDLKGRYEEAKNTNLNLDETYKEAKNTIATDGGKKGPEKSEYEKPDDARGPDGHGRALHYPREDRLQYVLGAAIKICEEEDAAGRGPGKEGGNQTEGTG